MVDRTHYWGLFGDGHVYGRTGTGSPLYLDPVNGQYLEVFAAPTPAAALNVVIRGATSGSAGIIRKIISPTAYVIEMIANPLGAPGFAFAQNSGGPGVSETLNFDNGGTAMISFLGNSQRMPLLAQHVPETGDARLNATIPADFNTPEYPVWHREAKPAQQITIPSGTLAGTGPYFRKGDRCTTPSGACTVVHVNLGPSDLQVWIIRKTGTISASQTLTNTTIGGGATGTIGAVLADPPLGLWSGYAALPNWRGLASFFEFIPDKPVGPVNRLLHRIDAYHKTATSVNDRGSKLLTYGTFDVEPVADAILGGVVIQVVKCTGTFPTSWTVGETVNGGGIWSGKVLGWNATLKYLFVIDVNGNTLTASTVTGATSGAAATSLGAAHGWQKGSTHWNAWVTEVATALGATNALYQSSPAYWEGVALMHWETELNVHSTAIACPYPSDVQALGQWSKYIADMRTHLGRADLPVTLWAHRLESQLASVPFGSYIIRQWMSAVRASVPRVTLATSDDFEMEAGSVLYLRWQDYIDLGDVLWRHLKFGQVSVPQGGYRLLPTGVSWGQSQKTGNILAAAIMAIDRDPDLWPSPNFGFGLSTIDQNCLAYNCITRTIQPFACDQNENTSWGTNPGTCGPVTPLAQRMKRRFSEDPVQSAPFCIFKFTVPGSACSTSSRDAAGCWDPLLTAQPVVVATCTVTIQPPVGSIPQRARFTATAGTFSGSPWLASTAIRVAGSAGTQGLGGNNSPQWITNLIYTVAGDGSYIELVNGSYAAEASRPFTFTIGPPPIWPEFESQWNSFVLDATKNGWIPYPVYIEGEQGESDLMSLATYQAAFTRVWQAIETLCVRRPRGADPIAKCIGLSTATTPWGTDSEVAQLRQIQTDVAKETLTNCALWDPSDLPMEINPANTTIRLTRQDNGLHRTARGHITAGFRVDAALAALGASNGIPPHPSGELAVDFGAVDGGTGGPGAGDNDELDDSGEDGGDGDTDGGDFGVDDAGDPVTVETGEGLPSADSYLSIEEANTRVEIRGATAGWTEASTATKNDWLRNSAALGIDLLFGPLWSGYRKNDTQALDWPRIGAGDTRTGRMIAQSVVPEAVKWAQVEWLLMLSSGVDPLRNLNPAVADDSAHFASATTDALPGGFSESRQYANGRPVLPVGTRLWLLLQPLLQDHDSVGLA